jgi:methionyl aminopeptidase
MATYGEDEWRLYSEPSAPVVQYTRTVIATRSGAMMFTMLA